MATSIFSNGIQPYFYLHMKIDQIIWIKKTILVLISTGDSSLFLIKIKSCAKQFIWNDWFKYTSDGKYYLDKIVHAYLKNYIGFHKNGIKVPKEQPECKSLI